jgi:hypothetical protein
VQSIKNIFLSLSPVVVAACFVVGGSRGARTGCGGESPGPAGAAAVLGEWLLSWRPEYLPAGSVKIDQDIGPDCSKQIYLSFYLS